MPNLTTLSATQTKPKINTYVIYQYIEENSRKLKVFGLNFCSCSKDSFDTKEIMSLEWACPVPDLATVVLLHNHVFIIAAFEAMFSQQSAESCHLAGTNWERKLLSLKWMLPLCSYLELWMESQVYFASFVMFLVWKLISSWLTNLPGCLLLGLRWFPVCFFWSY